MTAKRPMYYLAEILDLGFIGIYYLIFGTITSLLTSKLMDDPPTPKARTGDQSTMGFLILVVLARTFLITTTAYIINKIIKRIPFPFEGIGGFKKLRMDEDALRGVLISFSIIEFQPQYKYDIMQLLSFFK